MLIIKVRRDKAQEFDGSLNAVAKGKVNEYVHGKNMCCCTDNKERSPLDQTAPHSLRSFRCSALVLSYFHQVI